MGPIGQMIAKAGPLGAAAMGNDNPFSRLFQPDTAKGALGLSTAVARQNNGRNESVSKFRDAAEKSFPEILGGDTSSDTSPWAGLRTVGPHIGNAAVPTPAERPSPLQMTPLARTESSGIPSKPQPDTDRPLATGAAYVAPSGNPGASPKGPLPETTPKGSYGSYAYNRLINEHGLNPNAAAGIVGNLAQESGFADDVLSGRRRGDNGQSAYAAQWQGPRLRNLIAFARERGHNAPTFDDQIDFTVEEGKRGLDAGAAKALALLQNAQSPEEAADIFRDHFERPSADDRGSRRAHARKWAGARGDPNFQPPSFLAGAGGPSSGGDPSGLVVGDPNNPATLEPWQQVLAEYQKPTPAVVPEVDQGVGAAPAVVAQQPPQTEQENVLDVVIQQIQNEKSTRALAGLDRKNQLALLMRAGQLERKSRGTDNA